MRKRQLFEILKSENWREEIAEIFSSSNTRILGHLFSAVYSSDPDIKWHAVEAFGMIAADASTDNHEELEPVRILLRRCIWNLTEESGGIAWGAPEIIGEILANNRKLAVEYHQILLSYLYEREDGHDNFLDYAPLRIGVFWAVARLSEVFPEMLKENAEIIEQCIKRETEPEILAYLMIIIKNAQLNELQYFIDNYLHDDRPVIIHFENKLNSVTLSEVAHLSRP